MTAGLLGVVLSVVAATVSACGGAGSDDDIQVAFVGDFTAGAAPYSTASYEGAKLAVEEINEEGGVDGRKIKLSQYDEKSNPTDAVSIAQRVTPDADAVILGGASSPVLASIPTVEREGKPFFVTVSSNPAVTESGHTWVNRMHLSDRDQIQALVNYIAEEGSSERIALVHDTTDYGQGGADLAKSAMSEHGITPVTVQSYNIDTNDFTPQINALRNAKIDSIVFWGNLDFGSRLTEQMGALGLTGVQMFGGAGFVSPKYAELAGESAEGTIATISYLDLEDPEVGRVAEAYKDRTGRDLDVYAAQSYDLIHVLAQAVEKAGTDDPSALQKAIRATNYSGVVGDLSFDENGQNKRDITLMTVRDGQWVLLQ